MDPVHEHDLIIREKEKEEDDDKDLGCGGCGKEIRGQKNYYWCTLCELYFHERCAKLPREMKVFFHPCPLLLYICPPPSFTCNSCFHNCYRVFTYRCRGCDFDMCVDCTDQALSVAVACCGDGEGVTEHILHCCHGHPLQPLSKTPRYSDCPVCKMGLSFGQTWGCEPCKFYIHKPCLDFLPEGVQMNLLDSQVAATWILQTSPSEAACIDCHRTNLPNLFFRRAGHERVEHLCIFCCLVRAMIGTTSSQVRKFINHFFHPCPRLFFILSLPSSTCNACFLSKPNFSYHCWSCDFFLCFDCAQLPQLAAASHENEANQLVLHFCHPHPLRLFSVDTNHICNFCERFLSEPYYSCNDQCQFYIHKTCMDSLSYKTSHLLLKSTVVLLTVPSFECTTCNRQFSGFTFYCSKRKCKFCVRCVLWPENALGDDGRYRSVLHWHQLSLCETRIEHKRRRCFLCNELCIPWTSTYKCDECALFFHKSCAELPAQLDHPTHPHHHLTLTNRSSSLPNEAMSCKLCLKSLSQHFPLYDLVYRCQQCGFQLDTQCSTYLPSLEYKGHPHPLYVVVNMNGNTNCRVCRKSCNGSCTIRCADQACDFDLHLQCGPLPLTIKHASHVHPLVLKDYFVEDNGSDVFACHACEEERDPRLRVYCCSRGCLMICDVKCVLNEVLPLLRGEHGEVELRTPFPQVACRVINNNSDIAEMMLVSSNESDDAGDGVQKTKHVFFQDELIDSFLFGVEDDEDSFGIETLEEEEEEEEEESEGWEEEEYAGSRIIEISDGKTEASSASEQSSKTGGIDKEVEGYSFSWKALSRFNESLCTPPFGEFGSFSFLYDGSTTTGAYALPEILSPIYEEFFEKYAIIDHKCKLNYHQRRRLVFFTCAVIHEMRITKVVDVTKETIIQWLGWIRAVEEKGGFNVGILTEKMKQLWQAHYYIQSKKIVDDKTARLERELEQVSMYKAEQRTKMDELWFKVYEAEKTHQKLRLEEKEHDAYTIVGSRGKMKKVRSDALEIKWRTCYDSLVMYRGNFHPPNSV